MTGVASAISVEGDVAKLKQIELQLRRMTSVFLEGADSIIIRDLEGRVLDVNKETERVFGWSREEMLGRRTKEALPPEWQQQADEVLARLQRGETVRNPEWAVRTKGGDVVPVLVTSFLLTDDEGRPAAIARLSRTYGAEEDKHASGKSQSRIEVLHQCLVPRFGRPGARDQGLAEDLQERCRDFLTRRPTKRSV